MPKIQLSMKESKKVEIIQKLLCKKISKDVAAVKLKLTTRQIDRLKAGYIKFGIKFFIHKNRGKKSPNKTSKKIISKILKLQKGLYYDFGPVLLTEILKERHDISLSRETIRLIMLAAGTWEKRKKGSRHRKWRPRKERLGEMTQCDGSDHDWFEGRLPRCTLLLFTDDATGSFQHAEFAKSESYKSLAHATINFFKKCGMPVTLYTDKGKVFKVNLNNEEDEFFTQYQHALEMLGVGIIHANSPQAKGRVERDFKTLQDRLVKLMRVDGINSIENANKYLTEKFLPKLNKQFAIPPAKPEDLHVPVDPAIDLYDIFCIRSERTVKNDWTISYKNRIFQITADMATSVRPKDIVIVHEKLNGDIFLQVRKNKVRFIEVGQRPEKEIEPMPVRSYNPARRYSWRRTNSLLFNKKGQNHSAGK